MNELSWITAEHLRRCAIVYVRQSSTTQVEHNRELSRSSVATSSVRATTRSAPSDAIAQWTRRIDSSRVDSKQNGKALCWN